MEADTADRASRNAALALTLALPGDTVLYLLLPLYAATFGVTLPEAGLLLAANRIVRIFGYGWVASFYANRGPRAACLLAAIGAVLSTFGCATLSGVWALLLARLLWGLSFAAMNIANQALPTAVLEGASRRMGRARAIVALGPMAGLLGGATLANFYGPRPVFLILSAVALLAPIYALRLPTAREPLRPSRPRIAWPNAFNTWSFCMGFTLDGLFVFGLSLLAASGGGRGSLIAAGSAMALRYASEIVLSPASGMLAHRYGARRLLIGLSLGCAAALALIGTSGAMLWFGVLATVVIRALLQPLPAPVIAEECPGAERVPALARQAVWRDIGAGAGPLAAGLLFPAVPALAIYTGAGLLLAGASVLLSRRRSGS
jgi:MFS family permease